jgi:hypothetical protein
MGRISYLLDFIRTKRGTAQVSDVKSDPGGGANVTAQNFSAPGDDSHPLPGDYVALVNTPRAGVSAAVGYADPKDLQLAQRGEKRLYSRDADGNVIATIWIKNDGTIVLENDEVTAQAKPSGEFSVVNGGGYFKLLSSGVFDVNNVTISPAGAIVTPDSLTSPSVVVNGKELAEHTHPESGGGTTGPNNP